MRYVGDQMRSIHMIVWLDFDERLFYSSPLEDTGVCKYSFSHTCILHVVFSHSEQEGEPEVDDNASITNDQGDAYDEVLVQGIIHFNCLHNEA